jgi:hypothetical protein
VRSTLLRKARKIHDRWSRGRHAVKDGRKQRALAEVNIAALNGNALKGTASAGGLLRLPIHCHHPVQSLHLNFDVQHGLRRHPAEIFAKLTGCAAAHYQMSVRSPKAL